MTGIGYIGELIDPIFYQAVEHNSILEGVFALIIEGHEFCSARVGFEVAQAYI
jgi:hypothetical protein